MKMIEDLGMQYATKKKSKRRYRFGMYECPICLNHFRVMDNSVKTKHTTKCRSCATSMQVKKTIDGFTGYVTKKSLREVFDYIDGNLIYKKKLSMSVNIGDIVGSEDNLGYIKTKLNGKSYGVHRLIWIWHNGVLSGHIDHIDHNPSNNKIENLREVSHQDNMKNQKVRKNNTSGTTGVVFNKTKNKWEVRLSGGYYGAFVEKQEAINRRLQILENSDYHKNHAKEI